MHIISNTLKSILAWLTTVDQPTELEQSVLDWSDLPPHHPAADWAGDVHNGFIAPRS